MTTIIHEAGSNWSIILAVLRKYHPANTKIDYNGIAPAPGCDTLGKLTNVPDGCALRVVNDPDPRFTSITIERQL
jgi:hypothetical protein